jgi:predicted nuclease with RNAse H fold
MRVIGIDLAGSEKRDSGFCLLDKQKTEVCTLHSDKEILERIKTQNPKLVAIDAPLSLPIGRASIDQRNNIHFRKCDLELRRLGIRFFPITLGPMRMLTKRGMELKEKINRISKDIQVVEVYPGATYDIFKTNRKDHDAIFRLFKKQEIELKKKEFTQDELDAIACALTGTLFLQKKANGIGDPEEGQIIIPKL